MEILSPAGNYEAFLAAVNNGADAVYMGGKNFGARAFAGNFGTDEIAKAVKYAHLRNVKVYVTVNTLVNDDEMEAAVKFVVELYNLGVDAVIIQDWGLIHNLRQRCPQVALNASTQMTIHNSEGCEFAEKVGFKRAILAREVSIDEMARINNKVDIETEVFVHGALCICYSGQCLFSSLVGGRSGNRGRCAQPCRLKYMLVDSRGNVVNNAHLLSPKDLNGIEDLERIAEVGVVSAKIEGRMKRPEYVATVVGAYAKANKGMDVESAQKDLEQAFNREFTSGYLHSNQGADMMSYSRPNNRGIKLGRVEQILPDGILLKLESSLAINDGVEIWVTKGGRQGFTVDNLTIADVEVEDADPGSEVFINTANTDLNLRNVRVGDRVFKTLDYKLNEKARATFDNADTLAVAMKLIAHEGEHVTLRLTCRKEQVEYTDESFVVPAAQKHPATIDSVHKQLARLGGSGWYLSYLETEIDDNIMIPASVLNNCRRMAIAKIEDQFLAAYEREPLQYCKPAKIDNTVKYGGTQVAALVDSNRSARAAIDGGADIIYLSAVAFRGVKAVSDDDLQRLTATGVPIYMVLPIIAKEGELAHWQRQLKKYDSLGVAGIVCGNSWAVNLAANVGYQGEIVGDFSFNYFNSDCGEFWRNQGVARLGVSTELNLKQIAGLRHNIARELLVFGNLRMMTTEHCVLGANCGGRTADKKCSRPCLDNNRYYLQDEKGYQFPVRADEFCRNHIYNGHMLCMIEDLPKLIAEKPAVIRLDLLHLRDREIREATEIFHMACQMAQNGFDYDYAAAKKQLQDLMGRPFTKGHYYRGVE